jgi:hypothetical protein
MGHDRPDIRAIMSLSIAARLNSLVPCSLSAVSVAGCRLSKPGIGSSPQRLRAAFPKRDCVRTFLCETCTIVIHEKQLSELGLDALLDRS